MTPETKHHLLITAAVGVGAIALYGLYRHAVAVGATTGQAGANQGSQGQQDANSEAYLQELALSGAYSPIGGGVSMAGSQGVEAPNFAADLESSIQLLQGAGILPTATTTANATTGTTPAPPVPNPTSVINPRIIRPRRITGKRFFPVVL